MGDIIIEEHKNPELKEAVKHLYLREVISEDQDIAVKTRYSKASVSVFLNGKERMTAKFKAAFEKAFELSLDDYKKSSPSNILPGEHNVTIQDYLDQLKEQNEFLRDIIRAGLLDLKTSSDKILQGLDKVRQKQAVDDVLIMDSLDRLEKRPEGTLAEAADNAEDALEKIRKNVGKATSST